MQKYVIGPFRTQWNSQNHKDQLLCRKAWKTTEFKKKEGENIQAVNPESCARNADDDP